MSLELFFQILALIALGSGLFAGTSLFALFVYTEWVMGKAPEWSKNFAIHLSDSLEALDFDLDNEESSLDLV